MIVQIEKPYQGCKVGDRVTFDKAEGLRLVAEGYGREVRWDETKQEYVDVRRVSISVSDGAASKDGV